MASKVVESSKFTHIDVNTFKVKSPRVILSSFIPLGENGIIALVDRFHAKKKVKIDETDLYYYIKCSVEGFTVEFFSKGLVSITKEVKEIRLGVILSVALAMKEDYRRILVSLLNKYQLSLIEVFGGLSQIPIHVTITFDDFDESSKFFDTTYQMNEELTNQKVLDQISLDQKIKGFIGILRSKQSREYEDVLIGTNGSIIRSIQIEELLVYHAFTRSLHLFLTKFNSISEAIWNEVQEWGDILEDINHEFTREAQQASAFSSRIYQVFTDSAASRRIRGVRSKIMSRINELEQIPILTEFIQDSLAFTREDYSEHRDKMLIYENAFHIRKTLNILADRTKHSSLISENLRARGKSLLSQLDVLSSELISNLSQTIQTIGILIALIGIPLAFIAFIL